ncbi:unnamed protein product [Sphagnum tenellum]
MSACFLAPTSFSSSLLPPPPHPPTPHNLIFGLLAFLLYKKPSLGSFHSGNEEQQQQQQQQQQEKKASQLFAQRALQERRLKPPDQVVPCPRCQSLNTKFCYYNNYSLTQPRHFCKNCRRYWTAGGTLRNVPVGGGCRKNKLSSKSDAGAAAGGGGGPGLSTHTSQQVHAGGRGGDLTAFFENPAAAYSTRVGNLGALIAPPDTHFWSNPGWPPLDLHALHGSGGTQLL